ncbi:N-acetylneuraminate synthase [Desulfoplanes sp.]
MSVLIIAEAGVNHNGSLEQAKKLVEVAAHAGADVVKFQTFRAENIVAKHAVKAEYQKKTTDGEQTQFEMLKRLELSTADHVELMAYCKRCEIRFLSTPFDLESADFLSDIGQNVWKIASGEITNLPYLRKIGSLKQEVIMSTGMADLGEIEDALSVLKTAGTPRDNITVLHCNTEYPTPMQDVNLLAMKTIEAAFPGIRVGYSDHTVGIEVPIAAVAIGATVIEKHFTLDRNLPGPDHRASLEPGELEDMVRSIRNIETAMGSGIKTPSPSESKNKPIARKSIVAGQKILKGEILSEENLAVKRPGTGLSPMRWDEVVGTFAKQDFQDDDFIKM